MKKNKPFREFWFSPDRHLTDLLVVSDGLFHLSVPMDENGLIRFYAPGYHAQFIDFLLLKV